MSSTEVVPLNSADIQSYAEVERARFLPIMNMTIALERRESIKAAFQKLMVDAVDYGTVPGTGSKPTLLQPGAQKLDNLFGMVPRFVIEDKEEDWSGERHGGEPFFRYLIKCQVFRGDFVMGEAVGECNSWESKYRWRTAKPKCPNCGQETVIWTRQENYWCNKHKGGCGVGFKADDERITSQKTGRIPNPEIFDQVNTLIKIAQKRAHVAATINATSASEFFTQDVEDTVGEVQQPMQQPEVPEDMKAVFATLTNRDGVVNALNQSKAALLKELPMNGAQEFSRIIKKHGLDKSTKPENAKAALLEMRELMMFAGSSNTEAIPMQEEPAHE